MARNTYIQSPSAVQIMSTVECKKHLRIDFSNDDDYINSLAMMAQQTIENYCNIILMETTVRQYCQFWEDTFELFHSPVQNSGEASITHIKYYDDNDVLQTLASSKYSVNLYSCPVQIVPAQNEAYPPLYNRLDAIEVRYRVGYPTSAEVPQAIKQCILILVGQYYENRQVAVVGRSVGTIPMTAQYLMEKYKIQTLGL